jgi:hypothetical protein
MSITTAPCAHDEIIRGVAQYFLSKGKGRKRVIDSVWR